MSLIAASRSSLARARPAAAARAPRAEPAQAASRRSPSGALGKQQGADHRHLRHARVRLQDATSSSIAATCRRRRATSSCAATRSPSRSTQRDADRRDAGRPPAQGRRRAGDATLGGAACSVQEIVADRQRAHRPGRRAGPTGGRAVFDQAKRTLVLTEDPVLHDGPNQVAGERVVVYLDEERSVVEGGRQAREGRALSRASERRGAAKPPRADGRPRSAVNGRGAALLARRAAHQVVRRPLRASRASRIEVARRRGGRPARPERRRQDDDLLHDRRPHASRRRARCSLNGEDVTAAADVPARARAASAICRRSRRSSASSRSRRTSSPSWRRSPLDAEERAASGCARCSRSSASRTWQRARRYSLSGGERRRLEITRALVISPAFMLLDEPFAGIDPIAVLDIQSIVTQLKKRGIGVLITDHNVRETLGICDRAYILNEGAVLEEGTPAHIAGEPARARDLPRREVPPVVAPIGVMAETRLYCSTADAAAGDDAPAAAGDQDPPGVARRARDARSTRS